MTDALAIRTEKRLVLRINQQWDVIHKGQKVGIIWPSKRPKLRYTNTGVILDGEVMITTNCGRRLMGLPLRHRTKDGKDPKTGEYAVYYYD